MNKRMYFLCIFYECDIVQVGKSPSAFTSVVTRKLKKFLPTFYSQLIFFFGEILLLGLYKHQGTSISKAYRSCKFKHLYNHSHKRD